MADRTVNSRLKALLTACVCAVAAPLAHAQALTVTGASFPLTQVNQTTSQTITITANSPVDLVTVQIAPGYNTPAIYGVRDFTMSDVNCTPNGQITHLAAGRSCTITVNFTPAVQPGWSNSPAPIGRWAPLQIFYADDTLGQSFTLNVPMTGSANNLQVELSPGLITDLVGNDAAPASGYGGDGLPALNAVFTTPSGIAMDVLGNIYIADTGNGLVRLYYQAGSFPWINGSAALTPGNVYTIAGIVPTGSAMNSGPGTDGVVATNSALNAPAGVALDATGNLYIADTGNNAVRRVSLTTGIITTVAGTLNAAAGYAGDGGPAAQAQLAAPAGIIVDGSGNLYIADSANNAVRVVYAGGASLAALIATEVPGATAAVGTIHALAGGANTPQTNNGDGGLASAATLNLPTGVTVDSQGDVYIADQKDGEVRRVDTVTGNISTVYTGDLPVNLAIDVNDSVYFTLKNSCAIGEYNPTLQTGLSTPATIVAVGDGVCIASGDGGLSTQAGLSTAAGVVVDGSGNIYALEGDGVRMVTANNVPYNFGTFNVGAVSPPVTFLLTNDNVLPYLASLYPTGSTQYVQTNGTPYPTSPYAGPNPNVGDCNGGTGGGLASGQACGTSFTFQPIADGSFPQVVGNSAGGTLFFSGQSTGPLPTGTFTGGPLTFTAPANGTRSPAQTLTLTNTSAINLFIQYIFIQNPTSFQETDTCGYSAGQTNPNPTNLYLLPGASCQINVTFSTTAAQQINGAIFVQTNASNAPTTYTAGQFYTDLTGYGTAIVNIPVNEVVHVTDTPTPNLGVFIPVSEAIHVTDVPAPNLSVFIPLNEVITVTDGPLVVVTKTATTTTLGISASPIAAGTQETFTVQVAPSTASGTVNLYDGFTLLNALTLTNGAATYSTTSLGAGIHSFHAVYPGNTSYAASTSSTAQVIVQTPLIVTAQNISVNFATTNPAFTYSVSGFVNGDTSAVLSGAPSFTTTAQLNSEAGIYPITVSQGTLTGPTYYTFNFVNAALTITGGQSQTISFAAFPAQIPQTIGNLTLTAKSTSTLKVAYQVSGPATVSGSTLTLTGTGTVSVTASQAGDSTFAAATPVTQSFEAK